MDCPHCSSTTPSERADRTKLGYRRFRCRDCGRSFNERSGGVFNRLQYPTDVVCLVVLWRLRYKLSLRDLAEMFLERGFVFSHEAVREWEAKLAPHVTQQLRQRRQGKAGESWYVDETYVKVEGRWCYLYRAIDREGYLIDVRLSANRDLAAAEAFFLSAVNVTGITPDKVTTDGLDSYSRAIRNGLGDQVTHRTNRYLNNHIEQDHRGIKQRYWPMLGFKSFLSAGRFCQAFDEVRSLFRFRTCRNQSVSLSDRRRLHQESFAQFMVMIQSA